MRVAVTGATGNVGSSVVPALLASGQVEEVVGICRRPPAGGWSEQVRWVSCDVGAPHAPFVLESAFAGCDAVVHLAWQIQPARDLARMRRTNVDGSTAVFAATRAAGVPVLVHASSVGAYSAGPKDTPVAESWPTGGIPSSTYSRRKSEVERALDQLEADTPQLRVVRLRPGLIFQARAASAIARYFLGPFIPWSLLQRRLLPVVPSFDRLAFQAVHTEDVAAAYVAAVLQPSACGAYNIAADPVLDREQLARALDARPVPVPRTLVRGLADVTYRLRVQPTDAGWVDLAVGSPIMSTARAKKELGWAPRHDAVEALLELIDGIRRGAGGPSPVLAPEATAGARMRDAASTAAHGGAGAQNP